MICVAGVGANPFGTCMALVLLREGFNVVLCEQKCHLPADPTAATLQPPTLQMLVGFGSGDGKIRQRYKAPVFQIRDRSSDNGGYHTSNQSSGYSAATCRLLGRL